VYPEPFEYSRPASLDETLRLLRDTSTKPLAGGQSLIPLLKLRLASVSHLVDVGQLPELHGVRFADGKLRIGAATTYAELLDQPAINSCQILHECIRDIADTQVRNRGTVGGSLAHNDPAADLPPVVLALGGELVMRSVAGTRTVAIEDFLVGPFATAMEPGELLTDVVINMPGAGVGAAYAKLPDQASGYPVVGVASVIRVQGRLISDARIAITGVGNGTYRAAVLEGYLRNVAVSDAVNERASALALEGQVVGSDARLPSDYHAAMVRLFVRRSVADAVARANSGSEAAFP
jgi:aerobic carbon-monoxide dehydrogenase medium subunit